MGSNVQNDGQDSSHIIESLKKSLGEMVRRLEAKLDKKMKYMDARLKELSIAQRDSSKHRDSNAQNDGQDHDLTIGIMEKSLQAMEKRLEDKINRNMQSMNEKLKEMFSKHMSETADHARQASREILGRQVASIGNMLESIRDAVGINVEEDKAHNNADRKRLKEKLKEALEVGEQGRLLQQNNKESWMEYVFGICNPDERVGKRGSRYVHT